MSRLSQSWETLLRYLPELLRHHGVLCRIKVAQSLLMTWVSKGSWFNWLKLSSR